VKLFNKLVLRQIKIWADKTQTTLDDFLIGIFERSLMPLFYFGVFYLATRNLKLNPFLSKTIDVIGMALLTIIAIRFLLGIVSYSIEKYWLKKIEEEEKRDLARERSLKGILLVIKVLVWGGGIIFFLDNLGFKISTVIAGLGIGGVAIALAAQAILGDLFSYISIFFDRPFEIGDFIVVGEFRGTVEHIGIKTTRIRSLGGEQLVFSNTDLTNSRVRNYKRMERRRVLFSIGVTYQTTLEQLKEIPQIVTRVIEEIEDAELDRVHFASYGDFSLNFEIVYYVIGSDYKKYMDIQQRINLALKEEFDKRGIEFAYPTQTLFLTKA
jgi:small-conductance mechanosensitive channel